VSNKILTAPSSCFMLTWRTVNSRIAYDLPENVKECSEAGGTKPSHQFFEIYEKGPGEALAGIAQRSKSTV
jgi:hypothetical protein